MQRKRDKPHAKAKKTKKNKHWEHFKNLRKVIKKEITKSYHNYINNIIGESLSTNPKRFWPFTKQTKTGLSCQTQLVEAVHDWASSMNNNKQTDILLLDFSKAFDTVPHKRLLNKLNYYGITGPTLQWINSFLSKRTETVSINGSHSSPANVISGVPQGSVLGHVLFLVYINDITDSINSNIRLFADDSILYREIQTPKDHDVLQTDLNKLSEWATKWQMNFNIAKCHLLRITQKRKTSHFTYTITNQPISQVEPHPYLGITIDSKLSWSEHIHTTTSQYARTLGLLGLSTLQHLKSKKQHTTC